MEFTEDFNLPEFMLSRFGRVDFGGNLFAQWPVGIRFAIGLEQVSRAIELHRFVFDKSDDCILVSADWPSDIGVSERFTSLFRTPEVFHQTPPHVQTLDISPFDESRYRLTWTQLPPTAFDADKMMQAIARRERGGSPAIRSGVYTIDPSSSIIMHMYDDRGLDLIATSFAALLPVYKKFGEWVVDGQRHMIEMRFKNGLHELSS